MVIGPRDIVASWKGWWRTIQFVSWRPRRWRWHTVDMPHTGLRYRYRGPINWLALRKPDTMEEAR